MHDVDIRIARIFNTYGPNMLAEDGRVISNFIVQALMAKPITIYGEGIQTRSFCYVSDLITDLTTDKFDLNLSAVEVIAFVSFGKQDPP